MTSTRLRVSFGQQKRLWRIRIINPETGPLGILLPPTPPISANKKPAPFGIRLHNPSPKIKVPTESADNISTALQTAMIEGFFTPPPLHRVAVGRCGPFFYNQPVMCVMFNLKQWSAAYHKLSKGIDICGIGEDSNRSHFRY